MKGGEEEKGSGEEAVGGERSMLSVCPQLQILSFFQFCRMLVFFSKLLLIITI